MGMADESLTKSQRYFIFNRTMMTGYFLHSIFQSPLLNTRPLRVIDYKAA